MRMLGYVLILLAGVMTLRAASIAEDDSSGSETNSDSPTEAPSADIVESETEQPSDVTAEETIDVESSNDILPEGTPDAESSAEATVVAETVTNSPPTSAESSADGTVDVESSTEAPAEEASDAESPATAELFSDGTVDVESSTEAPAEEASDPESLVGDSISNRDLIVEADPSRKKNCKNPNASNNDSSLTLMSIETRNLAQLGNLLYWGYGFSASKFSYYGNYCGYNGEGDGGRDGQYTVTDECDKCCQVHDDCYGTVGTCSPYTTAYSYEWSTVNNYLASCTDDSDSCPHKTCSCDVNLVDCIRQVSIVEQLC